MTQFPHDDFAKAYLTELLRPIGTTIPNYPLKPDTRFADLWFHRSSTADSAQLGLLGELLTRDALIEVFRNPATDLEIRTSQSKLTTEETHRINRAKRKKQSISQTQLPWLWLIMPTASPDMREGFCLRETHHPGVYDFPRLQRTGLILVHQLAKTEQTLWLRVLGRGKEQKRAIDELTQIPEPTPLYRTIEELLTDYRAILESRGNITPEDEELLMNLSTVYLKQREEWRQEGRQRTLQEVAIGLLRNKIDPELILEITGLTPAQIQALSDRLSSHPSASAIDED